MENKGLKSYVNQAISIIGNSLGKNIYTPTTKDVTDGSKHCEIKCSTVTEIVIQGIGKDYFRVFGDSNPHDINTYFTSDEIGTSIFCDKENAEDYSKNIPHSIGADTALLLHTLSNLELMNKNLPDLLVFGIAYNHGTDLFDVVAEKLQGLVFSNSLEVYGKYFDNIDDYNKTKPIIACETCETHDGRYDTCKIAGVIGQRCFFDSEEAWNKVAEMNENIEEYRKRG